MDIVNQIIDYESGELNNEDTLKLFSHLIKSGQAWSLQGHYGRAAQRLIDNNLISEKGKINWTKLEELKTS